MLYYKESWMCSLDNSFIRWLKIFYIYRSGIKKYNGLGFYVYASIKKIKYLDNNAKLNLLHLRKIRSIIFGLKRWVPREDASGIKFYTNNLITLKSKNTLLGSRFSGPAPRCSGRLKFILLFRRMI